MVKKRIENETKEDKFRRIASARANRILEDLRLLGNCSNKALYSYSEEEVNKIFNIIEKEVKRIKLMYENNKRRRIEL
ncbi:MAG: hypothetical protein QXX20_04575 [Candidatus Thermoplasmatota archaeon]